MSTTTTAAPIRYRKTKTGEWVAYGPLAAFKEQVWTPGGPDTVTVDTISVSKRDGATKVERVSRLGKPFTAEGTEMVYGYLAPAERRPRRQADHEDCLSFAGCVHGSTTCDYH